MKHKGRKILCMALVLTLSASYPASGRFFKTFRGQ